MYSKLSEICDKNIIVCKGDISVPELLSLIDREKPLPFVILEENNNLIGFLTANHLNFAFTHKGCFKNTLCKNLIMLSAKKVHASLLLLPAVEDIISSKVDGYVLIDENQAYIGIVTTQSLFDHFFSHKSMIFDSKEVVALNDNSNLNTFLSDVELLKKYNQAKERSNFSVEPLGPIIVLEPKQPIPTYLPNDVITQKILNSVVKYCNSVYEKTYHVSKSDLIDKQTGAQRLPDNSTNRLLLKYYIEHNFRGLNVESHEKDSFGNDLWFLNNTFFEIENDKIIRLWVSKQDITFRKNLEKTSWIYNERFNEIFDHSIDSFFVIDVLPNNDLQFARINPTCEKNIGLSNDEIRKMPILDLFPGATGSEMIKALNRCLKEDRSIHVEDHLTFPASTGYYSTTLVPVHCTQKKIIQIIGMAVDITKQKNYENEMKHLNWSLLALSNGNAAIARAISEKELIKTCCQALTTENEYFPLCGVLAVTDDPQLRLKVISMSGKGIIYEGDDLNFDRLVGQECMLNALSSSRTEMQALVSPEQHSMILSENETDKISVRSVLAVPMMYEGTIHFIFVMYSKSINSFNETVIRMFEELGNNILLGIVRNRIKDKYEKSVIEREKQSRKLEITFRQTLGALGSMLEHRDPYTSGHQKRVADLAAQIARLYGLDEHDINTIYLAATVHDIGKITVPAEILTKPSKLTDSEFEIIKVHPEAGYQVLKDIDFPGPIAQIVRQHHEYLDGSGYPLGLKGDEILIHSKILTVADIVEAMSTHRPYRPALGIEFALREIKKMRGIKLDPKAVDICVDLFETNAYQLPIVESIDEISVLKSEDLSRSLR